MPTACRMNLRRQWILLDPSLVENQRHAAQRRAGEARLDSDAYAKLRKVQ